MNKKIHGKFLLRGFLSRVLDNVAKIEKGFVSDVKRGSSWIRIFFKDTMSLTYLCNSPIDF